MKFANPNCPDCGAPASGTLEILPGIAELYFDEETGEFEYGGYTEVIWDGQQTDETDEGISLCCHCGTRWPSLVIDE